MNSFTELDLPESLVKALAKMGLDKPTPVQAQTIPLALEGCDILGSAQTGTGKTLAFTLPIVKHLLENPNSTALVLAPIREIAQQVMNTLKSLMGDSRDFNAALLIGGEPYPKQLMQLKSRPRVVIGTPGRVIDHLERGTLNVNNLECLALDETDRMFDMGFGIQLDHIISKLPTKRQTLMFSATIAPPIEKLAAKYLRDPKRIAVGSASLPIPKIKQEIVNIQEKEKYGRLLQELDQRDGTVIVFVKTKMNADRLAEALRREDHTATAIHGDLRQHQRERVIRSFRQGKCRVMVATDIAARGLDIPHLMHVINYDVPPCPEDYVHRIGRTGRAGAEGFALCFVTSQDAKKWNAIERYMNPKAYEGSNRNSGGAGKSEQPGRRSGGGGFGGKHPFANNDRKKKPFSDDRFGNRGRDSGNSSGFGGRDSRGPSEGGQARGGFGARDSGGRDSRGPSEGGQARGGFGGESRGGFSGGKGRGFGAGRENTSSAGAEGGQTRSGFGGESRGGFSKGGFGGKGFGAGRDNARSGGFNGESRGGFSKPSGRADSKPSESFGDNPSSAKPKGGFSKGGFGKSNFGGPSKGGFGGKGKFSNGGFAGASKDSFAPSGKPKKSTSSRRTFS